MPPSPDNAEFELTLNGRTRHRVAAGASLLTALQDQGIFLPSACGGHGACGLCRVRVDRGAPPDLTSKELKHLAADEQRNGTRLACQVSANRDLAVTIPDDYLTSRAYRGEVSAIRDLTHDIRELRIRLLDPGSLSFKAGQYIQLQIPRYDQIEQLSLRSYSIASAPAAGDIIELEIRFMPQGLGTTYIFKHLKLNDPVRFYGPSGDFYLRDSPRDILLIAGGSGMAPMKSMLEDMRNRKIPRATRYFFGARSRRDLFLLPEMQQLETDLPDFKFIPALSLPLPDDTWNGETGLITEIIDRQVRPGAAADAYLCGTPAMIDACIAVLVQKGFPVERIYYDKFTRQPARSMQT